MESKDNSSSGNDQSENKEGPFLSSNVKEILKRRREDKHKKGMKRLNLISMIENKETNDDNNINDTENDNENEDIKMIDDNEKAQKNKEMKEIEKKVKKNYKSIYSTHNNLDINFNTNINKTIDSIKSNKKNLMNICCKEAFILIINIISFILFYISFIKRIETNIIYYYFIYPISKISFILLLVNSALTSIVIILLVIKQISLFHIFYSLIFYMSMYFKYHLINNNISSINYFDPANCHFFIYFILMIHTLGLMFILYNICYYFYLSGQLSSNDNNLSRLFVDYWESERKIQKLEKYIKINLDQLITSKRHSHDENVINKKRNCRVIWRIVIIGFIIFFIHGLLMFKKYEVFNCDYFNKELLFDSSKNNSNNINIDKYCKLPKPKGYCYMNALNSFFDIYNNMNNCTFNTNYEKEKEYLIDSLKNKFNNNKINENTKIFGYPLTNNKDFYFNEIENNNKVKENNEEKNINNTLFEEKIYQEIYDYDKNSNNNPEAILDYSDEKNPILKIDLKHNQELSKDRKKVESNDSLFKNVFVIYLSGVSQFYFKSALPKLSSFISKFSNNNPGSNNQMSMNSFQFTRYHSFSNDSFSNYFLMFNEYSQNSIQNIKPNLINNENIEIRDDLKYFINNGYITGQSIDTCNNFEHQLKNKKTFWDHENVAISCDPNYINNIRENNYCLYGNPFYSYHINYALQFWEKYKDNKKYFRLNFNSINEKTGSLLSYLDEPLYDLFIKLNFNGLLDETAIFFVSEYGGAYDMILSNFGKYNEKEINMKFGTFVLLMNKKNKLSEEENKRVYKNQNFLLTPFDIYASLVHIAMGNKINNIKIFLDENSRGESIFKMIEGSFRNCNFYKNDWIDEKFCSCLKDE